MKKHKTAFVSYSWDSTELQAWIRFFTNELRKEGVDANCDQFILQRHTKNLNQMMIEGIRDNDFVIFVLTENYKGKSDSFQGGVGFEQLLSLSTLRENPDKLILIKRSQADYKEVLPFHLHDYPVMDFSNDAEFENNIKRLVYRIYGGDYFEVAALGSIPTLNPVPQSQETEIKLPATPTKSNTWLDNLNFSVSRDFTDYDKNTFMKNSFEEIIEKIKELLQHFKEQSTNINYSLEDNGNNRVVVKVYKNGQCKTGLKIWKGEFFGNAVSNIYVSYGLHSSIGGDSFNEMITCVVSDDNELELKMTFDTIFSNNQKGVQTPENIVLNMWENHLKRDLM